MTRRHLNALIDAALAEYGDPAAATAAVLAQMRARPTVPTRWR